MPTFAPVFHGIRFKVKRLFVVMTSNFFLFFVFTASSKSNNSVVLNALENIIKNSIPEALLTISTAPGIFTFQP